MTSDQIRATVAPVPEGSRHPTPGTAPIRRMEPRLSLTGVGVHYPGAAAPAVAGVDLDLAEGEVLSLLGPSGCGKSSLLRAIAGLETPSSGTIRWSGEDLAGTAVHRRGFGLMFQEGQLFPHRSVGGNVVFGLLMTDASRTTRRERVRELLDLVGLAGYGDRAVATLSGGEQQRVALARALAPRPRLLLLDEPLSALDRSLRERLSEDLARILRAADTTALYVTHDHDEAFTVADRVGIMRAGHLVQVGRPADIWARPADADVASFLGLTVISDGAGTWVLGPRALWVTPSARATPRELLGPLGPRAGTVLSVAFLRGEPVARVDVPGWGLLRARIPGGDEHVEVGMTVQVHVDPLDLVPLEEPAPADSAED